jgi:hypothetical protein
MRSVVTILKQIITGFVLVVIVLFEFAPADAQTCFRGKPAPECSRFWITESGVGYVVNQGGYLSFNADAGLMFNVGKKYAAGSTIYISFDNQSDAFRGGLKLRFRRWFNPDVSINMSGGLLFLSKYSSENVGFTGHLALNYKDLVAPYLGLDAYQGGSPGAHWQFGIRLGSYPGLSGIAVGAVIVALVGISRITE